MRDHLTWLQQSVDWQKGYDFGFRWKKHGPGRFE